MIGMEFNEVFDLALDLRQVSTNAKKDVRKIVRKGAMNIKRDLAQSMGNSRHFFRAAGAMSFDDEDVDGIGAVIGPDKQRTAGALGNIAYFGTSRGGGTVEDPALALQREATQFVGYLELWAEAIL